jgi:hypothetical protein
MNIPGFAAESSLGPTMGMYIVPGFTAASSLGPARAVYGGENVRLRTKTAFAARTGSIEPQQAFGVGTLFGGDCFGSVDQCLDTFCVNLPPGKQKAQCFAACQQPSVCGGCRCSCTPDCVRTCEVECTKSTTSGSAILKCTRSCVPISGFPFPGNGSVSTNP